MMAAQGVGMDRVKKPTPEEHLKNEEKRIRIMAARATGSHPEWREDMEQEMRIRALMALESWDPEKGPLSAHTWRYMSGSHIGYIMRLWTSVRGYRHALSQGRIDGMPRTGSLEEFAFRDDGSSGWEEAIGVEDDGYRRADARFDARYVTRLLAEQNAKKGGPPTDLKTMLERIASLGAHDEQAEVAARQGVSRQAVNQGAHRAIKALRLQMGLAD